MNQGITSEIISIFKKFPKTIDGKDAILEMKNNNGKNWKQMEWAGFYFEYWCNQNLKNILEMPSSKKYGQRDIFANISSTDNKDELPQDLNLKWGLPTRQR